MGWPRRCFYLKARKKQKKILIHPCKTHKERCACFLFACRKYIFLVSWFVRFALYIFALNLLPQMLAFIFHVNIGKFCSCSDCDPSFLKVSLLHFLVISRWIRIKSVCLSLVTASLLYITTLFLKWLYSTCIFYENAFCIFFQKSCPFLLLKSSFIFTFSALPELFYLCCKQCKRFFAFYSCPCRYYPHAELL